MGALPLTPIRSGLLGSSSALPGSVKMGVGVPTKLKTSFFMQWKSGKSIQNQRPEEHLENIGKSQECMENIKALFIVFGSL